MLEGGKGADALTKIIGFWEQTEYTALIPIWEQDRPWIICTIKFSTNRFFSTFFLGAKHFFYLLQSDDNYNFNFA